MEEKVFSTIGELRELLEKFSDNDFVEISTNGFSILIDGYWFDEKKHCLYLSIDT